MKSAPCTKARVAMSLVLLACCVLPRAAAAVLLRRAGSPFSAKLVVPAILAIKEESFTNRTAFTAGRDSLAGRGTLRGSLDANASRCPCKFEGQCSCAAAIRFMNCVAAKCEAFSFSDTCSDLSARCPNTELLCNKERATCTPSSNSVDTSQEDIVQELHKMRTRKCDLVTAADAGNVNAQLRLRDVKVEIQTQLDMLRATGAKEAIYMGCGPPPRGVQGREWHASWVGGDARLGPPSALSEPSPVAAGPTTSSSKRRPLVAMAPGSETSGRWHVEGATGRLDFGRFEFDRRDVASYVVAYAVLVLLCAVLYDSMRFTTMHVQPKVQDDFEAFKYGLFDCSHDWKLSLFSLLCLPLRWADTMDKAHDGTLIRYWPGVFILVVLIVLNVYVSSAAVGRLSDPVVRVLVGVALLALLVTYRQKLRARYEIIPAGEPSSYAEDTLTWLLCPCCAAVQEARQVEANLVQMERSF